MRQSVRHHHHYHRRRRRRVPASLLSSTRRISPLGSLLVSLFIYFPCLLCTPFSPSHVVVAASTATASATAAARVNPTPETKNAPTNAAADAAAVVTAYRLQQQLLLQSRSLILRQVLLQRGVDALQHGGGATAGSDGSPAVAKVVDWDCASATERHPKSCLYSFDAETGSKVIAPIDTEQWITLSALNRLRRTDPTKVEPLWHSQYQILSNWFAPSSPYSLYTHLTLFPGTVLSLLLDAPVILASALVLSLVLALLLTLPVWEGLLQTIVTSPTLWLQWPNWGRFVHAALPLKLLLGQLAWKVVATGFGQLYTRLRTQLVEWECQILEDCIPLTIVEDEEENENESNDDDDEE